MNLEEKVGLNKTHIKQFNTNEKKYNQHYVGVLVCSKSIYDSLGNSLKSILLALGEKLTKKQYSMLTSSEAKLILDAHYITAKTLAILNEDLCDYYSSMPITYPEAVVTCGVWALEDNNKETYKLLISLYLLQERIKKYFTYVFISSEGKYYYDSPGDVNLQKHYVQKYVL